MFKAFILSAMLLMASCASFAQRGGGFSFTYPPTTFGLCDPDFDLKINNSGTYKISVSNPAVIQVVSGKIHIVGLGQSSFQIDYNNPDGSYGVYNTIIYVKQSQKAKVKIDPHYALSCDGQTLTYTVIIDSTVANSSYYQWFVNGAAIGVNNLIYTNIPSRLVISRALKNNDTLVCTVTNPGICAIPPTTSDTVIVNLSAPSVTVAPLLNGLNCAGAQVSYTATANSTVVPLHWQWQVNGKNTGPDNAKFTGASLHNGDVINCILTYNYGSECSQSFTVASNFVSVGFSDVLSPVIFISPSQNPICNGASVTFTSNVQNAGINPVYQWQINGQNKGLNSAVFTAAGFRSNDVVTCAVYNADCTIPVMSDPVVITLFNSPVVKLNGSISVVLGTSKKLEAKVEGNILKYSWSPSLELDNANIAAPMVTPTATREYALTITSTDGCEAQGTVTVNLIVPIIIPNTFTPNGDGINDTWSIPSLAYYPRCLVRVFNRNGILLLQSAGYPKAWDGTYNGKPLPVGTYYYVIESDQNKGATLSGPLTIVK